MIDPRVKQKLVLSPIEDRPDGVLQGAGAARRQRVLPAREPRRKKGLDSQLPGEGLLIWRVVNNRPILEESHGVDGAAGRASFPTSVPFPSAANDELHAVHDAVEQEPARRRAAGVTSPTSASCRTGG